LSEGVLGAGKRYAVVGAGRQGAAAAYDLATAARALEVRLLDRDEALAGEAAARVDRLAGRSVALPGALDAGDPAAARRALEGCDAVLSAVPYFLNPALARAAVEVGASFCDLGGNTAVVEEELALDALALERGVSVVPDCGLAPGMANTLAAHLIERIHAPRAAHIRVGGLPQRPRPPLDYMLVFAIEGLTNEYTGEAIVLREGKVARVPTLEELEEVHFPPPVGRCEAFTTSGGTSTCPRTYEGRLATYDYKTVRYPGHCEKIRVLKDLGLLGQEPVEVPVRVGAKETARVAPRALLHSVVAPRLSFPGEKDLVVVRVTVSGEDERGAPVEHRYELVDLFDEATGFSAMERTTAYPAAIVCAYLASGMARKGALPLEKAVPGALFVPEAVRRGLRLRETISREAS
jgi:lysine 6-dehydrogenase